MAIDEAPRGGFYIGDDGRAHDAAGEDLGLPLPQDFPQRSVFTDQEGLLTVEQVCEVEDLTEISGVGDSTAESVADYLDDLAGDAAPPTRRAIRAAVDRWTPDEPEDDEGGDDGDAGNGDEGGDDEGEE